MSYPVNLTPAFIVKLFRRVLPINFSFPSGISFAVTPLTTLCTGGLYVSEYLDERRWYTVYSKPQKEEFAQSQLRSKGLEVFLPRLLLPNNGKKHKRIVPLDRKSTRLNSSHLGISYAVFCLKKKNNN